MRERRAGESRGRTARPHCYVCDKVASLCICDRVPQVKNRTAITILQDRREQRHPFGTVRIARLGLDHVAVHVVGRDSQRFAPPEGAALLFPAPGAPLLSELSEAELPTHLVAVDGTWGQAATLRRTHPQLARLRTVALAPSEPSRYRIRKEPNERSVSTLEAIVHALRILEPETQGFDALLESFDAMIDDQLERRGTHPRTPRHRLAKRIKKALPEVLTSGDVPTVLVYTELHQPRGQQLRFPLRVTAARVTTARGTAAPGTAALARSRHLVDALVRSPLPPSPQRIRNMELGELSLDDALEPDAVSEMLREVIRPDDTLVAWGMHPASVLRELGFDQPFVSAKHHFANETGGRLGRLGDVVERLGLGPVRPWAAGRAGRQLARLDRVLTLMRERSVDGSLVGVFPDA